LVKRYKRFLADVVLDDGTETTAHCPNPGAMLGLNHPGLGVWLSRSDDPRRKLAHTLELVEADGGLVGVNTMNPNRLAAEAISTGAIPQLADYASLRREVGYDGDSRIDILLESPDRERCWVEVKNSHFLRQTGLAEFPDCNTVRGVKHLQALERRVEAGERAVMLFVVQATGVSEFDTADDIDKAYGPALREAAAKGVEVLVVGCALSPERIVIDRPMRWRRAV
jgi:sugar fermentation stimulation protein A